MFSIGTIYGETGRHQDLGPSGEPILSERMRVHGKVLSPSLAPLFPSPPSPFPSPSYSTAPLSHPPNPPNQINLTPSLPGKIHIPTPRAPLLRHRQALSPLPLPPHLRLPSLHAHREHIHPRRCGLDDCVFLYDFVAMCACGEFVGYVGWGADGWGGRGGWDGGDGGD